MDDIAYEPLNKWCARVGIGPTKAREEIRDKKYGAKKNGKRLLVNVLQGLQYYASLPDVELKPATPKEVPGVGNLPPESTTPAPKRRRGRPPGSKNKPKDLPLTAG
jgi:hypothetical protein